MYCMCAAIGNQVQLMLIHMCHYTDGLSPVTSMLWHICTFMCASIHLRKCPCASGNAWACPIPGMAPSCLFVGGPHVSLWSLFLYFLVTLLTRHALHIWLPADHDPGLLLDLTPAWSPCLTQLVPRPCFCYYCLSVYDPSLTTSPLLIALPCMTLAFASRLGLSACSQQNLGFLPTRSAFPVLSCTSTQCTGCLSLLIVMFSPTCIHHHLGSWYLCYPEPCTPVPTLMRVWNRALSPLQPPWRYVTAIHFYSLQNCQSSNASSESGCKA